MVPLVAIFHYLFVCGFSSNSRIFHLYGDVTIASEELQILTFGRHSWPLNSDSSLACHTYCHFIIVISEHPWHSHLTPSVWQWSCYYDLGLSRLIFEHLTFRLWDERSNPLRHRRGWCIIKSLFTPYWKYFNIFVNHTKLVNNILLFINN